MDEWVSVCISECAAWLCRTGVCRVWRNHPSIPTPINHSPASDSVPQESMYDTFHNRKCFCGESSVLASFIPVPVFWLRFKLLSLSEGSVQADLKGCCLLLSFLSGLQTRRMLSDCGAASPSLWLTTIHSEYIMWKYTQHAQTESSVLMRNIQQVYTVRTSTETLTHLVSELHCFYLWKNINYWRKEESV